MSHGFEFGPANAVQLPAQPLLRALVQAQQWLNRQIVRLSMFAMLLTALILSYSVVSRYLFNVPTDWQDEAAVFMLIGVSFLTAAYVQSLRGHIGIEVLSAILPAGIDRWRRWSVDLISLAFCAFFSWKSWTLFHEAWLEGQTTSSTFAPPLWIPYAMMAAGMTLLSVQILLQLLCALSAPPAAAKERT